MDDDAETKVEKYCCLFATFDRKSSYNLPIMIKFLFYAIDIPKLNFERLIYTVSYGFGFQNIERLSLMIFF